MPNKENQSLHIENYKYIKIYIIQKLITTFLIPAESQRNKRAVNIDCRKMAAVDSHNSIAIERKENINKKRFLYKNIFNCNLFSCHFVIERTPVSQREATGSSINTNKHYG